MSCRLSLHRLQSAGAAALGIAEGLGPVSELQQQFGFAFAPFVAVSAGRQVGVDLTSWVLFKGSSEL